MATETAKTKSQEASAKAKRKNAEMDRIILVSWPKVVFLYPSFLAAIVAGVVSAWKDGSTVGPESTAVVAVSLFFLIVLASNLIILAFDFPRGTSLTVFFAAMSGVLVFWLLYTFYPGWFPSFVAVLESIKPVANPTFYFFYVSVLGLIYLGVFLTRPFDYWEVRGNELLHHRGILSDLVRYPTERLKVEKEISDVFEYILLRSGTLILTPRDAHRPIVLENVLSITKKEKELARLLSTIDVKIDSSDDE
jgi:hypothetical protein